MPVGKDIRFIEPTSFEILPRPKRGMVGILMSSFPDIIRTESQANMTLIVCIIVFTSLSMLIIINSGTTSNYSRAQIDTHAAED